MSDEIVGCFHAHPFYSAISTVAQILLRIDCFVKNLRGAYDLRSDLTLLAALLDLNSQMDPRRDRRESVDAAAREILWVLEGLSSEFKTLGRDKRESVGLNRQCLR